MDAKNVVIITLTRDEAQKLLNTIDKLHDFDISPPKEGQKWPDLEYLLKLADALDALDIED